MTAAPPLSAGDAERTKFTAQQVCVIVSVYNEATVLDEVLEALKEHFDLIVCVDDGSSDGSGRIARAAGTALVTHPINLGAGAALQTGFTFALRRTSARVLVTFDGDGQHRAIDAVQVAAAVLAGQAEVALGSRFLTGDDEVPFLRRIVLKLGVLFTRATTHLAVTDTHNGLRALDRDAAERIVLRMRGMAHGSELLRLIALHGIRYTEVPVHVHYTEYSRGKGQSNVNAFNILADEFLQGVFRRR